MIPIWLIDDHKEFFHLLRDSLPKEGVALVYFSSLAELDQGAKSVRNTPHLIPRIVFIDYFLGHPDTGVHVLKGIQKIFPKAKTIAFSSSPNKNMELLGLGAHFSIAKTPREEATQTLKRLFPTASALESFANS